MNRRFRRVRRGFERRLLQIRTRYLASRSRAEEISGAPIFVVGCQRSGTSLLRRILDSHPRIACPPESKFIIALENIVDYPQAMEGLAYMGFDRPAVMGRLRAFVEGFFEDYAALRGKSRWADKTPNYVNCLPFIDELFGRSAQYVVIVRHPFDVCLSFEHAAHKSGQPMAALQPYMADAEDVRGAGCRFWNEQNQKIAAFMPQVAGRVIALDYESLTSQPEGVLRPVLGFLGEPWEPAVLEYNRAAHDFGFEDRKIDSMPQIMPNFGKFLDWPEGERRRLGEQAREAMEILGYRTDQARRQPAEGEIERVFVHVD
jgi:hypothetical protein